MVEQKMCRICMTRENLTSVFSIMDGGRISEKINFVCGLTISSGDAFPKLICHQCLSSIIIASSIKRKSLETDKFFQDSTAEDFLDQFSGEEDDEPILVEANDRPNNRFLVYEEDNEIDNQPKMNYNISQSSTKIRNLNHFNHNPELKSFIGNYMERNPNLSLIKVTDPESIQDIERVVSKNERLRNSLFSKRLKPQDRSRANSQISNVNPSRLLSALAGRRLNQVSVNRITSGAVSIIERK